MYRPMHECVQEWLDLLLLYSNKERHKKGALNLKEGYGSAVFYHRALLGRFYESNAFRMFFLVTFEDTEDLMNKIDEIYLRLDEDDSGGLVIEEFRAGLKNMHVKDPTTEETTFGIHLTPDDFDLISDNRQLLSVDDEFNQQQFRKMMLGELQRYARRTLRNAVVFSNNQSTRSAVNSNSKRCHLTSQQ